MWTVSEFDLRQKEIRERDRILSEKAQTEWRYPFNGPHGEAWWFTLEEARTFHRLGITDVDFYTENWEISGWVEGEFIDDKPLHEYIARYGEEFLIPDWLDFWYFSGCVECQKLFSA